MTIRTVLALVLCAASAACGGGSDDASPKDVETSSDSAAGVTASQAQASVSDLISPEEKIPVEISASVDGVDHSVTGSGTCTYTEQASIYNVPAAQWSVHYSEERGGGGLRSVNLTAWRFKAGSPYQFSFSAQIGSAQHRIDTVQGGTLAGSGQLAFKQVGAGGSFEIDGKSAEGDDIRASIICKRFTAPNPVGG